MTAEATPAPSSAAEQPTIAPQTVEAAPNNIAEEPKAPDWLPDRLKQAREAERKKLLSDFGADDPEVIKAQLSELAELKRSQLSEQERLTAERDELKAKADAADRYLNAFKSTVDARFAGLTEQQQAAIDSSASGDPEQRWKIMQVMEAAGAFAPPVPKPASTTPAGAPPPPTPATPNTPRAIYEGLQKSDPTRAALFFQMNAAAINHSPS